MANLTPVRQFTRHDPSDWTAERVAKLDRQEIEQLKANALERGQEEVAALCAAALQDGVKRRAAAPTKGAKGRRRRACWSSAMRSRAMRLKKRRAACTASIHRPWCASPSRSAASSTGRSGANAQVP